MSSSPNLEKLCLACGMCCDGTLFHDVILGPGDDAARLKAQGLPLTRSKNPDRGTRFPQPCAALCSDGRCRVYADRPLQCHLFECGVFKELASRRIEFPAALRLVKQARARADKVARLLDALGDKALRLSLGERFRRLQRRMESTELDDDTAGLFADLTLAVHDLNVLTHSRFYTKADDERDRP